MGDMVGWAAVLRRGPGFVAGAATEQVRSHIIAHVHTSSGRVIARD